MLNNLMDLALLCTHNPIVLGCKNHISPNIIFAGQKKRTEISLFLISKKRMIWHFTGTPTKK